MATDDGLKSVTNLMQLYIGGAVAITNDGLWSVESDFALSPHVVGYTPLINFGIARLTRLMIRR
jgi:hypothetical protein